METTKSTSEQQKCELLMKKLEKEGMEKAKDLNITIDKIINITKGKGKGQKGGKAAAPRLPKDTPTKKPATPKADPKKTTEKRSRAEKDAPAPDAVPAVNATPPKPPKPPSAATRREITSGIEAQQQTVNPLPPASPNNTRALTWEPLWRA